MRFFDRFIAKRLYLLLGLAALLMSDLVEAAEYPYLYRSPAYLGRGDTGISDANDENALLYNPAGIVMGSGVHRRTGVSLGLQTTDDIAVEAYNTVMGDEPSETTALLTDRLGKPINVGANAFVGTVYSRYGIGAYLNSTSTVMLAKDPDFGAFETATINSVTQGGCFYNSYQACTKTKLRFINPIRLQSNRYFKFLWYRYRKRIGIKYQLCRYRFWI